MNDHDYIESNHIIDRYISGRLDQPEREAFESHFLNCTTCLDELELAEAFQRDLKKTVAREAAEQILAHSLMARLLNARVTRGLGLVASLVILIGIPTLIMRQSGETAAPLQVLLNADERSGAQNETTIALTPSAPEVHFRQEVFADEYSRFRVSLVNTETDETEWQDQVLLRNKHLAFTVPQKIFNNETYRLIVDIQEGTDGFMTFDSHDLRITRE